jgi:class 3 adenylate cyclase
VPVDAGGSFGSKVFLHKVAVLTGLGARATGRPVKYIEDRIDNITACDNHGSDRTYDVELALDASYRMTALRYKVVDDYGAYFQYGLGTHGNGFSQTVGPYKIRAVGAEICAVFTNKCQQGACRGFGSEVTNFMIERIVDAAVDELQGRYVGIGVASCQEVGHEIGFGIGISRLCDEAKPGQILISPRVLTKVENAVKVEPVGHWQRTMCLALPHERCFRFNRQSASLHNRIHSSWMT